MHTRSILWLAGGLAVAQFGCASHGIHQAMTHVAEEGITAISYPETHRVAFLKRNQDVEHLCAGGGIDAVASSLGGLSLGAGGIAGSAENVGSTRETVETGLGGRDPVVLIARELLYRTCEMTMNLELEAEQSLELYKATLEAIQSIAESHSEGGTAAQEGRLIAPSEGESYEDD